MPHTGMFFFKLSCTSLFIKLLVCCRNAAKRTCQGSLSVEKKVYIYLI